MIPEPPEPLEVRFIDRVEIQGNSPLSPEDDGLNRLFDADLPRSWPYEHHGLPCLPDSVLTVSHEARASKQASRFTSQPGNLISDLWTSDEYQAKQNSRNQTADREDSANGNRDQCDERKCNGKEEDRNPAYDH